MTMEWEIYYGDGSTYRYTPELDSNIPEVDFVERAPTRDVQVIVQDDPDVGWVMLTTHDYYAWRKDRWFGVDKFGLWDYLASDGWKKVLFGRTLTNAEYQAIYERAKKAWREKKGFKPGERKPDKP
jgi:hypothetical protein